jgi:hypothetical protein
VEIEASREIEIRVPRSAQTTKPRKEPLPMPTVNTHLILPLPSGQSWDRTRGFYMTQMMKI